MAGTDWMNGLAQDLQYGTRVITQSPAFSFVALLTIGLGLGASTTVFSVANGVLIRPLPYPGQDRIMSLWRLAPVSNVFGVEDFPWGKADFNLYREETKVFQSLGAFQPDTFNLTGFGQPIFLEGIRATAGFFPTLSIPPALGRFFTLQEEQNGHEHVVVLSDSLWRQHLGASRNILGQWIELNGFDYMVVGVMPPGFAFPHAEEMPAMLEFPPEAQLWVPLPIAAGERGPSEMAVIGRLRPRVTLPVLQAELNVFARNLARAYPASKDWTRTRAIPLQKQILGDVQRPLLLLLGAVGLVLLIACSNVAGLLLTRSLGRSREFNIRVALGATSGRLIRQLMTESLVLAVTGGMLGLALADAGVQLVKEFGPARLPRLQEISLDPTVFTFCLAVTLLTGVLFGLAPSFSATTENVTAAMRAGARVAGGNVSQKLRNSLLIAQIALSFVLVVAAGLLVRTFYNLLNSDGGFKTEHVLTFEISLPAAKYPDPDHMTRVYTRALHALQSLPGVLSAGVVHAVPMGGAPDSTGIRVPGRTPKPNEQPYANYMFTSRGYFSSVRTPLLRGRDFSDSDTLASMPVTIVNKTMANALWPGQEAVGKQVGVQSIKYPVRTVIGVVANVKQNSLREETAPQMYVPFTQNDIKMWPSERTMQVALRTVGDPTTMTARIREAMRSVDPDLPLAKVAKLSTLVERSLTQSRFAMLLLASFGVLSLVLASVGMYGVISYSVTQRTREIGIRMALGADRATVFRMVLKQGVRLAAMGMAIGLMGAFAVTRILLSFLYGVRPSDPLTFIGVCALLTTVALFACWMPARRATRLDPMLALRED